MIFLLEMKKMKKKIETKLYWDTYGSPIGTIFLAWTEKGLKTVNFLQDLSPEQILEKFKLDYDKISQSKNSQAVQQLNEYFQGKRKEFSFSYDLNGTPFQQRVWKALTQIPFGSTSSYGDIAKKVGSPGASRAVGSANNKNPIGIIIPCHRVIGANGDLVGYASGLDRKKWLLDFEAKDKQTKLC